MTDKALPKGWIVRVTAKGDGGRHPSSSGVMMPLFPMHPPQLRLFAEPAELALTQLSR